jgi:hypothetical protein
VRLSNDPSYWYVGPMMSWLRCGGTLGLPQNGGLCIGGGGRRGGGCSKRVRISLVSALLASPDLAARISSSFTRGDQIVSSPLFAALLLISTLAHSPPPPLLHFFRAPKSIETVESVQNAFNEISFTRAYFVQRHCRIERKIRCTAVNTDILNQHFMQIYCKPTYTILSLQICTQSEGSIDYVLICLLRTFGQVKT